MITNCRPKGWGHSVFSKNRMSPLSLIRVSLVALMTAASSTTLADIHKCADEQGSVVYQQLPCPTETAKAADANDAAESADTTTASDTANDWPPEPEQREHVAEPEQSSQIPAPQIPSTRKPGERLDECKKRYRDQIDEIDAEIRESYSAEQGDQYKERLLALTRQLRGCG